MLVFFKPGFELVEQDHHVPFTGLVSQFFQHDVAKQIQRRD